MERRGRSSIDEVALVKAAAWAWYQHGSGSETRSMPESDFTRAKSKPPNKPSRYNLEAMKQVVHHHHHQETKEEGLLLHYCYSAAAPGTTHHHNPLLDKYEIERISKELECYIDSTHANYYHQNQAKITSSTGNYSGTSDDHQKKIDQRNIKSSPRGFGFGVGRRLRPAVLCGGSWQGDVVDAVRKNRTTGGSSRWPANGVAVVSVATCRPRSRHGK